MGKLKDDGPINNMAVIIPSDFLEVLNKSHKFVGPITETVAQHLILFGIKPVNIWENDLHDAIEKRWSSKGINRHLDRKYFLNWMYGKFSKSLSCVEELNPDKIEKNCIKMLEKLELNCGY